MNWGLCYFREGGWWKRQSHAGGWPMWNQPNLPTLPSWVERSRVLCERNHHLVEETAVRVAIGWRIRNGWQGFCGGSDRSVPTRPGFPHWPLHELEYLVRDKLRRGALFFLQNMRFGDGPATGNLCVVCTQAITEGHECEVGTSRGSVFTHLICHRVWWEQSKARPSSARSLD